MILAFSILMDAFFVSILAWCGYSDMKNRTISNRAVILLLCLGLAHLTVLILSKKSWWPYPAGMLLVVPFFIAWLVNGIGAGDVKLIAAISLYLGLPATVLAYVLMLPVLLVSMALIWRKYNSLKQRIPLAPIIGGGAFFALLLGYLLPLA